MFFNYREYLSALFDYHKSISPIFSHRYIVSKAGFKSPNSLKNVINGERNLSSDGADRFATAFKLRDKERAYFLTLVRFNTTRVEAEKERYLAELLKMRKSSIPANLNDNQLDILNAWWHVAVREMTALPDFKNSSLWVSRVLAPAVSHKEAAESLRLLKKLGFIKKTAAGWRPSEKVMSSDPEVQHVMVSMFHREMIRLGMESMARFSHEQREISSTTLRFSGDDIPRIKAILQDFRRQLLDFASTSQDADQIYQLNFQFFPLVNPIRPHRVNKVNGGRN